MVKALLFLVLIIVVIGLIAFLITTIKKERKEENTWRFVAKGQYDHAEYGMEYYTRRSGRMKTSTHKAKMTVVYMSDGSCYTGKGFCDMPFPRGTVIKVCKNGYDYLRVEKV